MFYVMTLSNYSIAQRIGFCGMIITGQNKHTGKEYRHGVDVFTIHYTGTGVCINTANFCN
jgi:hypothetical protein